MSVVLRTPAMSPGPTRRLPVLCVSSCRADTSQDSDASFHAPALAGAVISLDAPARSACHRSVTVGDSVRLLCPGRTDLGRQAPSWLCRIRLRRG